MPGPKSDPVLLWAHRQERPFALEAARAAFPSSDAAAIESALREDGAIAWANDRFYTPRVVALRTAFVTRLAAEERQGAFLVPGHRLLPFLPFDRPASSATLLAPDGQPHRVIQASVPSDLAVACQRFAPRKGTCGSYGSPARETSIPVLRLPTAVLAGASFRGELLLRCEDFDTMTYRVGAHPPVGQGAWKEDVDRFGEVLLNVIQSPPPGPVTIARQMLFVVSRLLSGGFDRPVGPLGALLTSTEWVRVTGHEGDLRFALARPLGAALPPLPPPRPDEPRALRQLRALLDAFPDTAQRRLAEFEGKWQDWRWRPDETALTVRCEEAWQAACDVRIDFPDGEDASGALCACTEFRRRKRCLHVLALARELARRMLETSDPLATTVIRDVDRPPWMGALTRLDGVLRAHARPSSRGVGTEARLVWHLAAPYGEIELHPVLQKPRKEGGWTPGRRLSPLDVAQGREAWIGSRDREAARRLVRAGQAIRWADGESLAHDLFGALEALVGHAHVFWPRDGKRPVSVEKASVRLELRTQPGGGWRFEATAGDLPAGLVAGRLFDRGILFVDRTSERLLVVPLSESACAILRHLQDEKEAFPAEALTGILARVPAIEWILPVGLPPGVGGEEIEADGRIHVLLTPDPSSGMDVALRIRPSARWTHVVPGEGSPRTVGLRAGRPVIARRDLEVERSRAGAVAESLDLARFDYGGGWEWRVSNDDDALDLLVRLQGKDDLVVEWPDGKEMTLTRPAMPGDMRLGIGQGSDWFDIEGAIQVEGATVPLTEVLEGLRRGRRYLSVGGGKWLRISEFLRRRLDEMADLLEQGPSGLGVGTVSASLLGPLLREAGVVDACASWRTLSERFDGAMRLSPDPPAGFAGALRDYQLAGYRWLARLSAWGVGCCLADDMGIGKTVQALAVLLDRAPKGAALVVAPTSVVANWIREAGRFAPGLRAMPYQEMDREADLAVRPGDLVVVSYALALRDAERLSSVRWGTLVLDEAQFVKNARTKTAAAVRRVEADWRLALTGTPMENDLGELWSLFNAISPGLFGGWERFQRRFGEATEPGRREALARVVRPFLLRRTKQEVVRELPERTEIRLDVELSPPERALYDQARLLAIAALADERSAADRGLQALAALTRLRQLACHPRLVYPEKPIDSGKVNVLVDLAEELRAEGHRALVFSQFVSFLSLVREALDGRGIRYRYLDGATPSAEREREVAAFQAGEGDLFLISLRAGGTGLNLTGADYVVHLDPWWNPAVEDQATGRAHRIGQTRPVTVYRLVSARTIEEKVLALHAAKRDLVEGILDGADQAARLSVEDLVALVREA